MNIKNKKIAVLFGGRAPEHEVSIITGIQALHALKNAGFETVPIYITKEGEWVIGDSSFFNPETFSNQKKAVYKRNRVLIIPFPHEENKLIEKPPLFSLLKTIQTYDIDVFFPCLHGRFGEDGSIQGLLELAGAVYTGCNQQASAVGMDKALSKHIARSIKIPTLEDIWITKKKFQANPSKTIQKVKNTIKFPAFVKPARLGSSIGIKKVNNTKDLKETLAVAFFYDTKVLIEKDLSNSKEINISIMGNNPYILSELEEPISEGSMLSFKDKYIPQKGRASKGMASAKRIIPAPIKKKTKKLIENYTKKFFAEIDGTGIARVDYLVSKDEKKVYFNEINTLPGSLSFYLWKGKNMNFGKLVTKLVEYALERKKQRDTLTTTFKSNILESFKGQKGIKLKL